MLAILFAAGSAHVVKSQDTTANLEALFLLDYSLDDATGNSIELLKGSKGHYTYRKNRFNTTGRALTLSDSASLTVKKTPAISFAGNSQWTFSTWIYIDSLVNDTTMILDNYEMTSGKFNFKLFIHDKLLKVDMWGGVASTLSSTTTIAARQWVQASVVSDGLTVTLYVNGSLASMQAPVSAFMNTTATALDYELGGSHRGTNYLNGAFDDTRFYGRALTALEIEVLYVAGGFGSLKNGLVLYLPLDGDATDVSGNGYNGVVGDKITVATNRFGMESKAMAFDGGNITIPGFGLAMPTGEISVSVWTYTNITRKSSLLRMDDDYLDNRFNIHTHYASYTAHEEQIFWDFGDIFDNGRITVRDEESMIGSLNQWEHYVFSSSENGMKVYLNGDLIESSAYSSRFTPQDASLLIGGLANGTDHYFFSGLIDDIRVYDRELTISDVRKLYGECNNFDLLDDEPQLTVCAGNEFSVETFLACDCGNEATFEWSNGDEGETFAVYPTESTTYTVTMTLDNGCQKAKSYDVVVFDLQVMLMPKNLCDADGALFEAKVDVEDDFSEGFEGATLSAKYQLEGDAQWLIDSLTSKTGLASLKSGDISDYQSTSVSLEISLLQESNISFDYMVSSENTYDLLKFFIDGIEKAKYSGSVDWNTYTSLISAGQHTLSWVYEKDGSDDDGMDCAWIDNISVSTAIAQYSWYYKGTLINDQASSTFIAPANGFGEYSVSAFVGECGDTSAVFDYTTAGSPSDSTIFVTACDIAFINGIRYTQTGEYTQILQNSTFCDSTLTINLTINESPSVRIETNKQALCSNEMCLLRVVDETTNSTISSELSVLWSDGSNASYIKMGASTLDTLSMVVTDTNGCKTTLLANSSTGKWITQQGFFGDISVEKTGSLWMIDSNNVKHVTDTLVSRFYDFNGPTRVVADNDGTPWVMDQSGGLYCRNGVIWDTVVGPDGVAFNHIIADKHNRVWVFDNFNAFIIQNHSIADTLVLHEIMGEASVNDVNVDAFGTVWMATTNGLYKLVDDNFSKQNLGNFDNATHVVCANDGKVAVAFSSDGYVIMQKANETWSNIRPPNFNMVGIDLLAYNHENVLFGFFTMNFGEGNGSSILEYVGQEWVESASIPSELLNDGIIKGVTSSTTEYFIGISSLHYYKQKYEIVASPVASIKPSPGLTICPGSSLTLTASGGDLYKWEDTSDVSPVRTLLPTATTRYFVEVADKNNCRDTLSVTITVPELVVKASSTTVCEGQSSTITATASNAKSYLWSNGAKTQTITVTPTDTTTYFVMVRTTTGCTLSDSVTVNVLPKPDATISATSMNICKGNSADLWVADSVGNIFKWNNSAISTTKQISVSPDTSSHFSVIVTSKNGCKDTGTIRITVDSLKLSIEATDLTICKGDKTIITAKGGDKYSWNGSTYSTTAVLPTSPDKSYTQYVTATKGSCTVIDSLEIKVNDLPIILLKADKESICPNSWDTLRTSGAKTYVWSTGATGDGDKASVWVTNSSTYTVTGTDVNGCKQATSLEIKAYSLPMVEIVSPKNALCEGDTAILSAYADMMVERFLKFKWFNEETTKDISFVPSQSTDYQLQVTDTNSCTWSVSSNTVLVNNPPTLTVSDSLSVCPGNVATLSASTVEYGTQYFWSNGQTASQISVKPSKTTTYYVVATGKLGCSVNDSVVVSVHDVTPVTIAPHPTSVCFGDSIKLTAIGKGVVSWLDGGTSSTKYAKATGTYSVTMIDNNTCKTTASVSVAINEKVASPNVSDKTIATNSSIPSFDAGASATWLIGDSVVASGSKTFVPSVDSSKNGIYDYNVFTTVGGCASDTVGFTLTVLDCKVPTISITSAITSICAGDSIKLVASGADTYSWSNKSADTAILVKPTTTTTYKVTAFDAKGCPATASKTITVNPLPTVMISTDNSSLCVGGSATLTASGAASYLWNDVSKESPRTVKPTSTTEYSVTGTSKAGCKANDAKTIVVNSIDSVKIFDTVCSRDPFYEGVQITKDTIFIKKYQNKNGCDSVVSHLVSLKTPKDTTYTKTYCTLQYNSFQDSVVTIDTVTYFDGIIGDVYFDGRKIESIDFDTTCTLITHDITIWKAASLTFDTAHVCHGDSYLGITTGAKTFDIIDYGACAVKRTTVVVDALPKASITATDSSVCPGDSVTLTAQGGVSFAWQNLNISSNKVDVAPIRSTTYEVEVTDALSCKSKASITIEVLPVPQFNITASKSAVCLGDSSIMAVDGLYSFVWENSSNNVSRIVRPDTTTSYVVMAIDSNGCMTTKSLAITVNTLPAISISATDSSLCKGESTVLNAVTNASSLYWSIGKRANSITVSPTETSTYFVNAFSREGCSASDSLTVSINPLPVVMVQATNTTLCEGESTAISARGGDAYAWNTRDDSSSIVVAPNTNATYTVTATSKYGCVAKDSVSITVNNVDTTWVTDTVCDRGIHYLYDTIVTNESRIDKIYLSEGCYSIVMHKVFYQQQKTVYNYREECSLNYADSLGYDKNIMSNVRGYYVTKARSELLPFDSLTLIKENVPVEVCGDIVITSITIAPPSYSFDTVLLCHGEKYLGILDTTGVYDIVDFDNCSINRVWVNAQPQSSVRFDTLVLARGGSLMMPDGRVVTEPGTDTTRFSFSAGCDSMQVITTIKQATDTSSYMAFAINQVRLEAGQTFFNAYIAFPEGSVSAHKLRWASTNTAVATVNDLGIITAISSGHTRVIAMIAGDKQVSAWFDVTVFERLDKQPLLFEIQKAQSLLDIIYSQNMQGDSINQYPSVSVALLQNVLDSSIRISETQSLTMHEINQQASIMQAAIIQLLVSQVGTTPVLSVKLREDSIQLSLSNDNVSLYAEVSPVAATVKDLMWQSSNSKIVGVDSWGNISPKGVGQAIIIVHSLSQPLCADTCVVLVKDSAMFVNVPQIMSIVSGESFNIINSILKDTSERGAIIVESDDSSVVKIDANGNIVTVGYGSANVIVRSSDGNSTVVIPCYVSPKEIAMQSLSIIDSSISVINGHSRQINGQYQPRNATSVITRWTTSNKDVAIVSKSGVVLGVSVGNCYIYYSSYDGKMSDSVYVTVFPSAVPVVTGNTVITVPSNSKSVSIDIESLLDDDNTSPANMLLSVSDTESDFVVRIENGRIEATPKDSNWTGTDTIYVTATDHDGQEVQVPIVLVISDKDNQPPSIAALPPNTIAIGNNFKVIALKDYVTDDFTSAEHMKWDCSSTSNLGALVYGGNLQVIILKNNWVGTEKLRLIATDEQGLSDTSFLSFIISTKPNEAPVLEKMPNLTRTEATDFEAIHLVRYVTDDYTPQSKLLWTFSKSNHVKVNVFKDYAIVRLIDMNWIGSETIVFTATDASGLSGSDTIVVSNSKSAASTWFDLPRINFEADRRVVAPGQSVNLSASISGATSWKWVIEASNTLVSNDLNPVISYKTPGLYKISLVAINKYGVDTLHKTKYINVIGITNRSLTICKHDSVSIVVSDSTTYRYKWSDGSISHRITVSPAYDKWYKVTISQGLFTYPDSVHILVKQPLDLGADTSLCINNKMIIQAGKYRSYEWSGPVISTSNMVVASHSGNYTLEVTDDFGCRWTDSKFVQLNPLPQLDLGADDRTCLNNRYTLDAGMAKSYVWQNGDTARRFIFVAKESALYSVTVTDNNGCTNSDSVRIDVLKPYQEEIALASHSADGKKVIVAWQRTPGKRTQKYIVYREDISAEEFNYKLGERSFADSSYLVDQSADARTRAYKYQLVTIDSSCSNQAISNSHKTIHLQTFRTTDNATGLSWNAYEGIKVNSYFVYRLDEKGTEKLIHTIPGNSSSLTASDYTDGYQTGRYRVAFKLDSNVDPGRLKSDGGPYSYSMSNIAEAELLGKSENDASRVVLYPNPAGEFFTVYADGDDVLSVSITNNIGVKVKQIEQGVSNEKIITVETANLHSGMYNVIVVTRLGVITKQLVVE